MQTHTLKARTKRVTTQQVGRGGTRGKTSGKGTKGQNARAGRKKRPELRDFIKRYPKLRGRGISAFKSIKDKPLAVNLGSIELAFANGETVNKASIISKGILSPKNGRKSSIKILGAGSLSTKLTFEGVLVSASAKKAIEAVGGRIK